MRTDIHLAALALAVAAAATCAQAGSKDMFGKPSITFRGDVRVGATSVHVKPGSVSVRVGWPDGGYYRAKPYPPPAYGYVYAYQSPQPYYPPPPKPEPTLSQYGPRPLPKSYYDTAIIVYQDQFRRLYQPRVHGHVAFIQVWSDFHGTWMTVGSHPSIW